MNNTPQYIAWAIGIIVLGLVIWTNIATPCKYFKWSATKDLPVRCLSQQFLTP